MTALSLLLPPAAFAAHGKIAVQLEEVAQGFRQPTDFEFLPDENRSILVLEQKGLLKRYDPKTKRSQVLLTLSIPSYSELGLLGIALHPAFARNQKIYLNYTVKNPATQKVRGLYTRVSEWIYSAKGLDPAKERILFETLQPYANHNGGGMVFAPDKLLYVGMGDGGSVGDPHGNGQNPKTFLGKMLRFDVDKQPVQPEIFARGLRNPWRFSFTPDGRLIAGDLGQNSWEEITFVPEGANLGWNIKEGSHCFGHRESCPSDGLTDPIYDYPRNQGVSVTGGSVYRGKGRPDLAGKYVFADFGSGMLAALTLPNTNRRVTEQEVFDLGNFGHHISAFRQDSSGEMYFADYASGKLFRLF